MCDPTVAVVTTPLQPPVQGNGAHRRSGVRERWVCPGNGGLITPVPADRALPEKKKRGNTTIKQSENDDIVSHNKQRR